MNKFSIGKNYTPSGSNTTATLFTVPDSFVAKIDYMLVSAKESKKFGLTWHDLGTTTDVDIIPYETALTAGATRTFENVDILLQAGDTVKIEAEDGSNTSVIVTFDIFPSNGVTNNFHD